MLTELGIDVNPIPTEEIGDHFNDLRSDMVLLYELKSANANLEFELQTLRHQASLGDGGSGGGSVGGVSVEDVKIEDATSLTPAATQEDATGVKEETKKEEGEDEEVESKEGEGTSRGGSVTPKPTKKLSEVIDVNQGQSQKKRKAALEQKNVLNKLKNR